LSPNRVKTAGRIMPGPSEALRFVGALLYTSFGRVTVTRPRGLFISAEEE
jgi:hypothetical protein